MPEDVTPAELSRELRVSPKQIRRFLRERTGGTLPPFVMRWKLDSSLAAEVRARFGGT